MSEALRSSLQSALAAFATQSLREASLGFFKTLGYSSQRTVVVPKSAPRAFLDLFAKSGPFDQNKALFSDWLGADLLFQLTDQEISREVALFPGEFSAGQLRSYIFIAVELKERDYPRGKLANLARQLNRLFPTPVMVLIKHRDLVSIAVINRRQNKVHADRDVLEKVTLIRDISLSAPHRGHLDILASFAVPNLVHPQRLPIASFDALHAAWEQIFNIDLLNERFYRELANWYFWALPQVDFPADLEPDAEKRRATGLIRLLTRLIFCWFLKEKGLIPDKLFHPTDLAKLLKGFDPESETSSTYYLAILQNLFFATLNQRMGKDSNGKPYRRFAFDEGFLKNKSSHDLNNYFRYEGLFNLAPDDALALFEGIPFLNGGLFECLDKRDEDKEKTFYLDGFSRNPKKRPHIPDRLFFDSGETADLSEVYDDKKRRAEKVTGLIPILNRYKFTIVENTPIDQEIALDPELLGKVFENLLASYNEETKTTARKQTGSFYTPRPIVDYMVDESLKAHLARALVDKARMKESDARAGLDLLFAYTEKVHAFTPAEVAALIAAIDALKILDPACGSGAFPMGVLHKLVYILGKLDPDNERWKQTQLAKLDSAPMREELERAFADNNDDYGRKLYLIENCLYGVDIQPIAIQITKLRFFISLVCDQKTNRNKKENHGIRPLPNLETKFVAADTLIGLPEMTQSLLVDPRVGLIENEIESLYHSHFSEQRRDRKLANQRKVKSLRQELGKLLAESLMAPKKAQHVAEWDPFDPQSAADFFDPQWMFGCSLAKGFDIVIGNPPYISYGLRGVGTLTKEDRDELCKRFPNSAEYKISVYALFMEKCISLCGKGGISSLIVPDSFLLGKYFSKIRSYILKECKIPLLLLIKDRVFDNVTVGQSVVYLFERRTPSKDDLARVVLGTEDAFLGGGNSFSYRQSYFSTMPRSRFRLFFDDRTKNIIETIDRTPGAVSLNTLITFRSGLIAKAGQATIKGFEKKNNFWSPGISSGGMVKRYGVAYEGEFLCFEPIQIKSGGIGTVNYKDPKLFVRQTGDSIICGYDDSGLLALNNVHIGEGTTQNSNRMMYVCAILNSSVVKFYYRVTSLEEGRTFSQIDIDMLDEIPVAVPPNAQEERIAKLVRIVITSQKTGESAAQQFLEDLIDACVMECYFREHMAEHDLLFHDTVAPHLAAYDPTASEAKQRDFLTHFHQTLNGPSHPIRNRLLRLTADSPDLLAVIKAEGRV